MYRERATITNTPVETTVPSYSEFFPEVSPQAAETIANLEQSVRDLKSPEVTPDDMIMAARDDCVRKYVGWFRADLDGALQFLGQNVEDPKELDAKDEEDSPTYSYGEVPPAKDAYGMFRRDFDREIRACGLDTDKAAEAESLFYDYYLKYRAGKKDELTESFGRFEMLATMFGTPEVLRAEAVSAAVASMDNLHTSVTRLGGRPAAPTLYSRIGQFVTGQISLAQDQFDREVEKKTSRVPVTDISQLLDTYISQAMLHYAKLSFGEVPYNCSKGFDSDPSELFDTYQARQKSTTTITRPLLPSEIVSHGIKGKISEMLYDKSSPLSGLLDGVNSDYQRQGRERRKASFHDDWSYYSYARNDYSYSHKTRFGEASSDSSEHESEATEQPETAEPTFSNQKLGELYREFSRLRYAIRVDSNSQGSFEKLESDFIERLKQMNGKDADEIPSLSKVLRRALRDNHPDTNADNPEAEQRYKFYSMLRDEL